MIWRFATGYMPCVIEEENDALQWRRFSHRGVQPLDAIHVGDKQRRDVFSKRFELRFDTDFITVLKRCADPQRDGGNWIVPELQRGYLALHEVGFAHSYECYEGGKLVGGCFGVHIGSFVSIESMYHDVPNASKAAYVRTLLHLRDRGFKWMDVNFVSDHLARWGARWMPRREWERELYAMARTPLAIADDIPAPRLPWRTRLGLPIVKAARGVARRLKPEPIAGTVPTADRAPLSATSA
jgi:leucyl/phenylalanyl-tRNA---protein transferase